MADNFKFSFLLLHKKEARIPIIIKKDHVYICSTVQDDSQDTSAYWNFQYKKVIWPIVTISKNSVHKLQFAFSTNKVNIQHIPSKYMINYSPIDVLYYVEICQSNKDVRVIDKEFDPQFLLP